MRLQITRLSPILKCHFNSQPSIQNKAQLVSLSCQSFKTSYINNKLYVTGNFVKKTILFPSRRPHLIYQKRQFNCLNKIKLSLVNKYQTMHNRNLIIHSILIAGKISRTPLRILYPGKPRRLLPKKWN